MKLLSTLHGQIWQLHNAYQTSFVVWLLKLLHFLLRLRPKKTRILVFLTFLNYEVVHTDLFPYLNRNKTLKLILPPSAVCLPTLFAHHHCVPAKLCALYACNRTVCSVFHIIYLCFILVYKFFFRTILTIILVILMK